MTRLGALRDALYTVAFTVAALAGSLATSDGVALVWPAGGVAALWLFRSRGLDRAAVATGIAAIAAAVPVVTGAHSGTAVALALSTVAGAFAAAMTMTRLWGGGPLDLRTLADGVRVAAVSVVAGLASGLTIVLAEPFLPARAGLPLALLVAVRTALGCLAVVSLALAIYTWGRPSGGRPRLADVAVEAVVTVLVYALVFMAAHDFSVSYAALPLTLWIGLRAGVLRTTLHTFLAAVLVATLTQIGIGPFHHGSLTAQSLLSQGFVAVVILAGLGLSLSRAEQAGATAEARQAAARVNAMADAAPIAHLTVRVDAEGEAVIERANPAAAHLLVTPVEELVGTRWSTFIDPADRPRARAVLARLAAPGDEPATAFELRHRLPSGEERWTEVSAADAHREAKGAANGAARGWESDAGGGALVTVQMLDVSARKEAEARLAHLALHDELTGLPNRMLLVDRVERALLDARRSGRAVAVVFIDVDHFKRVNDTLGHAAGDELLTTVARRLADAARESDTVARMGGDEFVACVPGVGGTEEARTIAERLLRLAGAPVDLAGREVRVGLSAGVAVSRPGSTTSDLLRESDDALYAAKHAGRGRVECYTATIAERASRHMELSEALETALAHDEFELHYQPIVDMRTGEVRALEALVRWRHPSRGLLAPAEWLDVAESSDVMVPLGRWVLREACAEAARQADQGRPLTMHVNVAAREFREPGLAAATRESLEATGLPPDRLVVELTETRLLEVHQSLIRDLEELRSLGVRIAADDFGTGYSSLRQLVDLPIDLIKIDRGFVGAMTTDPRAVAVVQGIIGMAEALGMTLVAEGVETAAQARLLELGGCVYGQGYLWQRPVPAAELLPQAA